MRMPRWRRWICPVSRATGFFSAGASGASCRAIVEKLSLRPPEIERAVASFSGGNRQKILLARGLTRDISVLSVRRAHSRRRCGSQDRDLRVDEDLGGDGRGDRSGLVRSAGGAQLCRTGSMSCIGRAWRPSSSAPTSTNRPCCPISSGSGSRRSCNGTWRRTRGMRGN